MGVISFKDIFFESFVKSSGASQTVFTFLLIPCCLTLNFRAPPFLPNATFIWAWNVPSEFCFGRLNEPLDLSLFSLQGSPRKDATGQGVTIFYTDRLGYYPYIDHITGTNVHGGIPQRASLRKHLEKAKIDIVHYMPKDNLGLAVIDWDDWRPTWERNWKPKDVYKNESIDLVQQENLQVHVSKIAKIAKEDFEKAAKNFMLETLKLGKLLRPNHLWGYYPFPDCYNHNFGDPSYNGACFDIEKRRNNRLDWLWKESTALFPSVYLKSDLGSSQKAAFFARNRVQEAIRLSKVRDIKNPLPVFVYTCLVFTDKTLRFLSLDDLVNTIGESVALGASGIVTWGSLGLMRSVKSCLDLDNYVTNTLNPYIINVTLAAKMCSQVLCEDLGVCIRKHWNSNYYLHLNPMNFAIQIGQNRKYTVIGKPSLEDLEEFSQNFYCSCYTNMSCKKRVDLKNVDAIYVCAAGDTCIDAFLNLEPSGHL